MPASKKISRSLPYLKIINYIKWLIELFYSVLPIFILLDGKELTIFVQTVKEMSKNGCYGAVSFLLTLISWAIMLTAISSGVSESMSTPIGA